MVWIATPARGESRRPHNSPRPNTTAPPLDSTAPAGKTRGNDRRDSGGLLCREAEKPWLVIRTRARHQPWSGRLVRWRLVATRRFFLTTRIMTKH